MSHVYPPPDPMELAQSLDSLGGRILMAVLQEDDTVTPHLQNKICRGYTNTIEGLEDIGAIPTGVIPFAGLVEDMGVMSSLTDQAVQTEKATDPEPAKNAKQGPAKPAKLAGGGAKAPTKTVPGGKVPSKGASANGKGKNAPAKGKGNDKSAVAAAGKEVGGEEVVKKKRKRSRKSKAKKEMESGVGVKPKAAKGGGKGQMKGKGKTKKKETDDTAAKKPPRKPLPPAPVAPLVGLPGTSIVVHGVPSYRSLAELAVILSFLPSGVELKTLRWLLPSPKRKGKKASSLVVYLACDTIPNDLIVKFGKNKLRHTVYEAERGKPEGKEGGEVGGEAGGEEGGQKRITELPDDEPTPLVVTKAAISDESIRALLAALVEEFEAKA